MFARETTFVTYCLFSNSPSPFWKLSTLKRKQFASEGNPFSPFREELFLEGRQDKLTELVLWECISSPYVNVQFALHQLSYCPLFFSMKTGRPQSLGSSREEHTWSSTESSGYGTDSSCKNRIPVPKANSFGGMGSFIYSHLKSPMRGGSLSKAGNRGLFYIWTGSRVGGLVLWNMMNQGWIQMVFSSWPCWMSVYLSFILVFICMYLHPSVFCFHLISSVMFHGFHWNLILGIGIGNILHWFVNRLILVIFSDLWPLILVTNWFSCHNLSVCYPVQAKYMPWFTP